MKKRIQRILTTGLIAVVTAMTGIIPVAAAGNEVKLYATPSNSTVTANHNVAVQIRLAKDTNAKVDYVSADMRFSANMLEIIAVSRTGSYFTENNGPTISFNNSNGTLVVTGTSGTMPSTADVLLATVTFRVKGIGTGSFSFSSGSVAGDQLGGGNVKNALTSTSGSSIVGVSPPSSSPTKTTTTTSSTPSSSSSTPTPADTPAATPPDATTQTSTNEQTASTESENAVAKAQDTKAAEAGSRIFGLELWQLIAGGLLGLVLLGAGAFVAIMKIRNNRDVLSIPVDAAEAKEETVEQLPDEKAFFDATPIPDMYARTQEQIAGSEPQPAVVMPNPVDTNVNVVDGIAIEPLDPSMPSPLADAVQQLPAGGVVTPPVATAEFTAEPVVLSPQAMPEQVSQQPAVEAMMPPQPTVMQTVDQVSPAPAQTSADEFPDMFEEGEARLRAEGLDSQLAPRKA